MRPPQRASYLIALLKRHTRVVSYRISRLTRRFEDFKRDVGAVTRTVAREVAKQEEDRAHLQRQKKRVLSREGTRRMTSRLAAPAPKAIKTREAGISHTYWAEMISTYRNPSKRICMRKQRDNPVYSRCHRNSYLFCP